MKILVIIFLLIITSMIKSNPVTLDEQQSDFIDLINEERRKFAIERGYGNIHKLYWNETLQNDANQQNIEKVFKYAYPTPVLSMDQNGINELNRARDTWRRAKDKNITEQPTVSNRLEYMFPLQTTVACVRRAWKDYHYTCFFGPEKKTRDFKRSFPGSICQDGFKFNETGLCAESPPQITSTTNPVNPNNNSNVLPTPEVPKAPLNPNSTPPGPKNPGNSNSTKSNLSPETRTLPKELEDYVEVDGDDYDEDFPTGEPPLDSGSSNFLQFWITVVLVSVFVLLVLI